jgi:hypothetical protein
LLLLVQITPHIYVIWRPDLGRYSMYTYKDISGSALPINGSHISPDGAAGGAGGMVGAGIKAYHKDQLGVNIPLNTLMCPVGAAMTSIAPGWTRGQTKATQMGFGVTHAIVDKNYAHSSSKGCGEDGEPPCMWSKKSAAFEFSHRHFTAELDQLAGVLEDVRKLMQMDLVDDPRKTASCFGPGLWDIRFGNPTGDMVHFTSGMKKPFYMTFEMMSSVDEEIVKEQLPARQVHLLEIYEQLMLCK